MSRSLAGLRHAPAEVIAALALAVFYIAVYSGRFYSPDGMLMFRQAEALAFDHSIHLHHPVWGFGPITESPYGIGLSLLYLPFVAVVGLFAPHAALVPATVTNGQADWAFYTQELYHDPIYGAIAPVHIAIAVVTVWLVARLVVALGYGRREALWAMVLCGLASPWMVYSRGDFAQPLEGLCWMAAFICAVKPGRLRTAGLGFAVFYAILTRPVEGSILALASAPLVLPRLWPSFSAAAGFVSGVLATAAVDLARFGWPIQSGYGSNGWTTSPLGLLAYVWSPARGLVWWFPAFLLAPIGLMIVWRSHRRVAIAAAIASVALFVSSGFWSIWWGGLDWGPRLMLPAIPLLAAFAGIAMNRLPTPVGAVAAIVGFVTSAPCLALDIFRGYGISAGTSAGSFDWQNYPPVELVTWLPRRVNEDIIGRPLPHGDIDVFWAHLPAFYPIVLVVMVIEAALLFAIVRASSRREEPAQARTT